MSNLSSFSFNKSERLSSKALISQLFSTNSSINAKGLRLIWTFVERKDTPILTLLSAPKRRFPRAVDRNFIKRRLKESFRTNKHLVDLNFIPADQTLLLGIIYQGENRPTQQVIQEKTIELLERLGKKLASAKQ